MLRFPCRARIGLIAAFGVLVAAAAAVSAEGGLGCSPQPSVGDRRQPDKFVVHEWGTFTSFSGSDSIKLEFRPLVDVDLPPFVLDRARGSGVPNPLSKVDIKVLQRMETPVTYFYSDRERQANVRVGFPQGLLTEFYPPVAQLEPQFNWFTVPPLTGGALDWGKIQIIPQDRFRPGVGDSPLAGRLQDAVLNRLLPASGNHPHYAYARETDSALVYVERSFDNQRPLAPRGAFFEKFLFYRGVGNFDLPLKLSAAAGGRFALTNSGPDPIGGLFLVTIEGKQLRFVRSTAIEPGQTMTLAQSQKPSSADELAEAMVAALIDARLYEKEARAMVKTWRSSWFGEEGTRLFYLLPQTITDRLLPLTIEPTPDELVRVMVGRLEIMRPEDEARVTKIVQTSAAEQAAAAKRKDKSAAAARDNNKLPPAILDLGRLAEPALVRVRTIAADGATRQEANRLLQELLRHRQARAAEAKAAQVNAAQAPSAANRE